MEITAGQSIQEPDIPMKKRNRTTIRFTDENYDYLLRQAKLMGLSVDDVLNAVIYGLRRQDTDLLRTILTNLCHSDSTLTATTSQHS